MKPRQMHRARCAFWCLLLLAGMTRFSFGDMTGPPPTFEELENRGVLIFKGTALSSQPIQDSALPAQTGLGAVETRFQVVSALKGQAPSPVFRFVTMN